MKIEYTCEVCGKHFATQDEAKKCEEAHNSEKKREELKKKSAEAISELIDKLVDVASAEKDKASQDFLWGFVREQVEEEATVQGILDKIKLGGDVALYHLDIQLGARK